MKGYKNIIFLVENAEGFLLNSCSKSINHKNIFNGAVIGFVGSRDTVFYL